MASELMAVGPASPWVCTNPPSHSRPISSPAYPTPPSHCCSYAAQWNPQQADVFLSASGDCTVKVGRCIAWFLVLLLRRRLLPRAFVIVCR